MKKYIRDKRSPTPTSALASKTMSAIKGKNTKPEITFRKMLVEADLRGYRLHWKVEGRPDIAFVSKKIAIFIHGCFWHRCPICQLPEPKSNSNFWQEKFSKNVARDKKKKDALESNGWIVMTIWECEIKEDLHKIINTVKKIYTNVEK